MSGRRHKSGYSAASGFTMIEVVVSLTVLSLILLATVSALRTFANTQSTLDRTINRVDEMRTVSSFLRDQIGAAVMGVDHGGLTLGGGVEDSAYFRGDAKSMEWKATVMFGESYGGKFLLRLERRDGELALLWQEPEVSTVDVDWSDAFARQLVSGVQDFSVAYKPTFEETWVSELETGVTPVLVRLRIKTRDRYWPDLVVEVPR